jgi:hypothetical protein
MHPIIRDMFVLSAPIAEKVLRPLIIYIFLVLLRRAAVAVEHGTERHHRRRQQRVRRHHRRVHASPGELCRRAVSLPAPASKSCILEPGGAFVIKRKCPSDEDVKHAELVNGLETLRSQLQRLEEKLAS